MQTKKRAKPVKFGKSAKEAEEKKVEHVATPAAEQHAAAPEPPQQEDETPKEAEAPAETTESAEPPSAQQGELVDKLSDVPFETDFGAPASPTASSPAEPSAPEPSAPAPSGDHHGQEEPAKPADFSQSATPQIDISPVQPNAPIGRANEPIPFNPHETVFSTPPDAGEKKKNPFLYFIIIAFVAFVTGIAFMAGIYYAMPDKNFFAMPSLPSIPGLPGVAQQPAPTELVAQTTPTAAPSKAVALSEYSVAVLNGSGVSGQAAKVKTTLEAEGFQVGTIGNADRNDYTTTQITVKKTVDKAAITKLTDALKKTYVLDKVTELPASATQESDITVTIGKETVE